MGGAVMPDDLRGDVILFLLIAAALIAVFYAAYSLLVWL